MYKRKLLTEEEIKLLDKMILNGISNDNSANNKAFVPTAKEYKMLFKIRKELLTN